MYSRFLLLLKHHNLKPADIAKLPGISASDLSKWKSNKSKPKLDKLKIIADFFHVTVDWLAGFDSTNEPYEYLLEHSYIDSANKTVTK